MQMDLAHIESDEVALQKPFEYLTLVRVCLAPDLQPKAGTGTAQLSEDFCQRVK
jgi:hypothetical protein